MVLQINGLSKRYSRKDAFALHDLSLNVEKGELLALIGESGSGKTTLLRLIAGFEVPDSGEILINDVEVAGERVLLAPEKRNISMVFQDYALFPHLNIYRNVAFGIHKWKRKDKEARVAEMLSLVGMSEVGNRFPHQLSGGQQQRIALARALAPRPELILLDEPFSNLDTNLKEQVREDIRKIIKSTNTTAVFVTHDTKDALSTADKIAILREGQVQQYGTPEEVFNSPENIYVANFFGKINILKANKTEGGIESEVGFISGNFDPPSCDRFYIGIRPEHIKLSDPEPGTISGIVKEVFYLGDQKQVHFEVNHQSKPIRLTVKTDSSKSFTIEETIHFKIPNENILILKA